MRKPVDGLSLVVGGCLVVVLLRIQDGLAVEVERVG